MQVLICQSNRIFQNTNNLKGTVEMMHHFNFYKFQAIKNPKTEYAWGFLEFWSEGQNHKHDLSI